MLDYQRSHSFHSIRHEQLHRRRCTLGRPRGSSRALIYDITELNVWKVGDAGRDITQDGQAAQQDWNQAGQDVRNAPDNAANYAGREVPFRPFIHPLLL
jgi:hypothetical protein